MKVIFYTATCMLDISLEYINIMKKYVDLHVLIEITPLTKRSNILNIRKLPDESSLIDPSDILDTKEYEYYKPYLTGTKSAKFVVHPSRSGFSYSTLKSNLVAIRYMSIIKPDIIHYELESMTIRSLPLLPYFSLYKNVYITIHDPVYHSGERNLKMHIARMLFRNLKFSKVCFYSSFAKEQFKQIYKKNSVPKVVLPMLPYTFYRNFSQFNNESRNHLLFFGRISKYKGLDVLLRAMDEVLKSFPDEKLLIVGKNVPGYSIDESIIKKHPNNITFINRYSDNEELTSFIRNAKFVICPYTDASQSGVLMTSIALNTPVIATNVGAFPEFIKNNVNGFLVESNNARNLAEQIIHTLQNGDYQKLAKDGNTVSNLSSLSTLYTS